ncbi:relaxase/mobilization nuclease-like protein [Roseinatronobacter thiooxidans]|uniref:Relaxase/mobilization nuclease-like protein n=1 Tax=Roseinatronobacter thiooxidans TaxID=121821 RepID=A0A2W7PNU6_9RHOB|nr:relaxase/mobilization nuclease domain-containing protein [Roseinatronobacter thiooxidans]PZX37961.1 relaxase/mobilization nuclease-like protein [Roseinatronobacter thiooxidans]
MAVSKIIPSKNLTDTWSRIFRLVSYILALKEGTPEGKCIAFLSNLFFSSVPENMIYEMQIAANMAPHNAKPIVHQVISWPIREWFDNSLFENIFKDFIEFYDLSKHQVIGALHGDKAQIHIHFVYNKFNIFTEKTKSINKGFDRRMGAMFCSFIERKYGFSSAKNSSVYKIGDEFYISDFYDIRSAGSKIRDKSIRLEGESVAETITKVVRSAISTTRNWEEFQIVLLKHGAAVQSGLKSGLVYRAKDSNGHLVHVAASRICREARRDFLENLFGADFEKLDVSAQVATSSPVTAKTGKLDPEPVISHYERYSSQGSSDAKSIKDYKKFLREIFSVFSGGGHVFYEKFSSKHAAPCGNRVLFDRRRGDCTALDPDEILELAPNIALVAQSSVRVGFRPLKDADIIAFTAIGSVIDQFCAQGWAPKVRQGNKVIFTGLPQDSQEAKVLRAAAGLLGMVETSDIEMDIAVGGAMASLENYEHSPAENAEMAAIISANTRQVLPALAARLQDLSGLVSKLVQIDFGNLIGLRGALRRVGGRIDHFLSPLNQEHCRNDATIQSAINQPFANGPFDASHLAAGEPDREPGGSFIAKAPGRSLADRPDPRDPGLGKGIGRIKDSARGPEGRQRYASGRYRQDAGHDGDSAQQPDKASAGFGSTSNPGGADAVSLLQLMRARIIANQYNLEVRYAETRIVLFRHISEGDPVPVCEITAHKIRPLVRLTEKLGNALQEMLHLPVERGHVAPKREERPGRDAAPSDDSPFEFVQSVTEPRPQPVKRKPRHLVFDPFNIRVETPNESPSMRITTIGDLDLLDLAHLTSITLQARNLFDIGTAVQHEALLRGKQTNRIDLNVEINIELVVSEPRHAPEEIVFIFDPVDTGFESQNPEKCLVIPISDPADPGAACGAVSPENLQRITLHRECPRYDEIDTQIEAFKERLEKVLFYQLDRLIDFEHTSGSLEELLSARSDYDDSFSM